MLLVAGLLFLLVAFSYAEGMTALPETGGAATFVRRAFNDLAGFMTGWVLFLDYLIVMALAGALRAALPRRGAAGAALTRNPWDVVVGVGVIVLVAGVRLVRRPSLYGLGLPVSALDLLTQLVLVVLGFVLVFSPHALDARNVARQRAARGTRSRTRCRSRCSRTPGLESVANLAEEARRPGVDLPRSLFVAIGTVVTVRRDRDRRAVGVPGPGHRARRHVAARAARRRRDRDRRGDDRRRSATSSASSSARAAR